MSGRRTIATWLQARLPHPDDDTGSLAMALMAILVGAMIGALMLPMILTQSRATRFDMSRVRALHAAQAGIDVVLGQIRASASTDSDGNTWGNSATLPCWTSSSPLTGNANSTGTGQYSVTITYWATLPSSTGTPMRCASGYGTYDPVLKTATPRYAVIAATGTDGNIANGNTKGRSIETTYVFQTDDTNIPGGLIKLFPDSSGNQWCMDAGSSTPAVGTAVVLRACSVSTPPIAQQVFAYRSDLSIQLVSSVTSANPAGLCIDTSPTAHASGVSLVLNTCAIVNPAKCTVITNCSPYNQQWSVNDNGHLEGAKSDQSSTDGYCINASAQATGTALALTGCAGGTTDTAQTWVPSPTAGAGMAGAANNQLVNYKQFATCLDVTGQDPNAAFLILYTCKQNPNPSNVAWNQKFIPSPALGSAPATVLLKTTASGTTYCLNSPLTVGGYVRVTTPCPSSATTSSAYSWTVYQTQDASGNDLPYAQKYTIVDSSGNCLGMGPNSDLLNGQYVKAVVTKCDGSTGQKWNANASLDAAKLTNTHETS